MMKSKSASQRAALVGTGFFILLGLTFGESAATAQGRDGKHRKDARTCQSFGASYGTPAYSDCMLGQQRRRDTKQLRNIEVTQMLSQIAKDGQIMSDRARRQRCDRNPNRRECGQR